MTFWSFLYKSEHNVTVNAFYVFFYSVFIYVYICVCTESNSNFYFYTYVFTCISLHVYLKLNQDLFVYLQMYACVRVCKNILIDTDFTLYTNYCWWSDCLLSLLWTPNYFDYMVLFPWFIHEWLWNVSWDLIRIFLFVSRPYCYDFTIMLH